MKNNRIPKTATRITAKMLSNTSAHKCGQVVEFYKDNDGWHTKDENGQTYFAFLSMLRNAEICEILKIV